MRALTRLKRAACATSGHLSLSRTARRAHAGAHLLAGRVAFVFLLRPSALDMQAHIEAELLDYLTVRSGSEQYGGGGRRCTCIAPRVPAHRCGIYAGNRVMGPTRVVVPRPSNTT